MKTEVSVIIPTLNEEKNIRILVEQIDTVLQKNHIAYQIIIVDDHSTDASSEVVTDLQKRFPIEFYSKKGHPGKAFSLLEGFNYARHELLCMIDADMQYPPQAIPEMINRIHKGADIVVANRTKRHSTLARKIVSRSFYYIFAKLLHGFSCDVQSGLKVFRKELLENISISPSPWTFDLEFLVKTRQCGYKLDTVDIVFDKRLHGKSKIGFLRSSFEIGKSALLLKIREPQILPFSASVEAERGAGFKYKGATFIHHSQLANSESAFFRLTRAQVITIVAMILAVCISLLVNWHLTVLLFVSGLTILYFADLLFNLFLIYRSFTREPEIKISRQALMQHKESTWPTYTILCPLYKEGAVLAQFVDSISQLDYPKEKLQVMLLLEADDTETIKTAKNMDLPKYFQIVVVPDSMPKTKPKACNYGLKKATGEYIVIYDAEDVPDVLQLKKAVLAFKKLGTQVMCIQAKLNFYNPNQNILTRLFTAEYSVWFELILTGLQSLSAPIPLGGTSNHFRSADLKTLNGWDPFNVTEDADLGIRLVKKGFTTAVLDSTTMEEANSQWQNWFRQRSRWIKGYIQTYFVHLRPQKSQTHTWSKIHVLMFQLIIGGKVLSMLVNPIMWIMTLGYFAFRPIVGTFIESFFLPPIYYMAAFSLIVGNFLYTYYYLIGISKRNQWDLAIYTILTPIYWLAMSLAAAFALWEVIVRPHYWHKTKHGLHLVEAKAIKRSILPLRWGRLAAFSNVFKGS